MLAPRGRLSHDVHSNKAVIGAAEIGWWGLVEGFGGNRIRETKGWGQFWLGGGQSGNKDVGNCWGQSIQQELNKCMLK